MIPKNTLTEELRNSKIAFIGKVLSVSSDKQGEINAEFEVQKKLQGNLSKVVSFKLQSGRSCDLGKYVEKNSVWVIFAKTPDQKILTGTHSRRFFQPSEQVEFERQLQMLGQKN